MSPDDELLSGLWRKSQHSNPNGACVELAQTREGDIVFRDSMNTDGPTQVFTRPVFVAFLSGIKNGRFGGLA